MKSFDLEFRRWNCARLGIAAILLSLIAGCRTAPDARRANDFFPIGIYSVPSTNDLAEVRAAGFNMVPGNATRAWLDAAQRNSLQLFPSPPPVDGKPESRRALREADGHPALWAWYLVDEPDLNNIAPAEVRRMHARLRDAGARKPIALVCYQGARAADYVDSCDILMIDRYPVPWQPLAAVSAQMRMGRLTAGRDKKFIAVLQAFDWEFHKELLPDEKNLRPPNYAELRCMVYQALTQRADGILFYALNSGTWKIREHPATWDALKRVVGEINDRVGLFQSEELWWPKRAVYGNPEHRFNAALDASITMTLRRVTKPSRTMPAGDYIVCVNTSPVSQLFSFSIPCAGIESLPVLGEDRYVNPFNDWAIEHFDPYAVHVYGPFNAKDASR